MPSGMTKEQKKEYENLKNHAVRIETSLPPITTYEFARKYFKKICDAENWVEFDSTDETKSYLKFISHNLFDDFTIKHGELFKMIYHAPDNGGEVLICIGFAVIDSKPRWFGYMYMSQKDENVMVAEEKQVLKSHIERREIVIPKLLSEAEADAFFLKECGADNLKHIPDDQIDKATFQIITDIEEMLVSQEEVKHGDLFKVDIPSQDDSNNLVVYIGFAEIESNLHWFYFLFVPKSLESGEEEVIPTAKKVVNISFSNYEIEMHKKLFASYMEALHKIQIGG